jgi:N-methylhydantoinase A
VVTVGGAAGVLGPAVAGALGAEERRAPHAAVLSSIGAALSLVRAEAERTVPDGSEAARRAAEERATSEARAEAARSGAEPDGLEVALEHDAARGTVRAVATGGLTRPAAPEHDEMRALAGLSA